MSKSTNKSLFPFCGCDFPRTKQVYVGFSNKKFRRYLKSDKDLDCECLNNSFYKKFGGLDWEYRGVRKGSRFKKFKKYKLNLFRNKEGELNTFCLHKPIKYNYVVNVKNIVNYTNNISKIYPKEKIKFRLSGDTLFAVREELRRLYYDNNIKEYNELKEDLYNYSYVSKLTAHECFKLNHRKIQKYFIRKR